MSLAPAQSTRSFEHFTCHCVQDHRSSSAGQTPAENNPTESQSADATDQGESGPARRTREQAAAGSRRLRSGAALAESGMQQRLQCLNQHVHILRESQWDKAVPGQHSHSDALCIAVASSASIISHWPIMACKMQSAGAVWTALNACGLALCADGQLMSLDASGKAVIAAKAAAPRANNAGPSKTKLSSSTSHSRPSKQRPSSASGNRSTAASQRAPAAQEEGLAATGLRCVH